MTVKAESLDDIVFKGRNKEYGAYYIRKKYNKYILFAFLISFLVITTAAVVPLIESYYNKEKNAKKLLKNITMEMDKLEEKMAELEKRKPEPQRQQVSNDGQFKTTLDQTRYELLDLAKRVDNMEKINSQTKNMETSGDIKRNLVMTHAQLDKLEAKINDIDKIILCILLVYKQQK